MGKCNGLSLQVSQPRELRAAKLSPWESLSTTWNPFQRKTQQGGKAGKQQMGNLSSPVTIHSIKTEPMMAGHLPSILSSPGVHRWSHRYINPCQNYVPAHQVRAQWTMTSSLQHNLRSHQLLQLPSFGLQDGFNYLHVHHCFAGSETRDARHHHMSRNCQKNCCGRKGCRSQKCCCIFLHIYSFHQRHPGEQHLTASDL